MNDVIVIGGGPAGSTAATLLARKGFSVLLLERDRFPRFQIGESLLPYNNDLFARLGVAEKLQLGDFFPKYGAQFVTGDGKIEYTFRFDRTLPPEYHSSFQVKRAEFDEMLLRNASTSGVDVREQTSVVSVDLSDPSRAAVETSTGDRHEARFVLDASGHGAVLGHRIGEKTGVDSLKKVAFFAHYRGVPRAEGRNAGNTVIVVLQDAWFWMIPVDKELMSVGLVVDRDHVRTCGLEPEELLNQTIAATPWVAERMLNAERVTQVYARRDFSYRMKRIVGQNYALIGDAAGFLDPIFSTGVFIAMKSADIASTAVEARLRKGGMRLLKRYERDMSNALEKYFRFISNFYRREFLEVFLQPGEHFGLLPVIIGVLAGNVFAKKWDRLKLGLFFALVAIQK
ncbi:MAG TPA: NAD(P)/FAD-dependent oxidoreductase, partial [Thermoanaerobaculia bacterium]